MYILFSKKIYILLTVTCTKKILIVNSSPGNIEKAVFVEELRGHPEIKAYIFFFFFFYLSFLYSFSYLFSLCVCMENIWQPSVSPHGMFKSKFVFVLVILNLVLYFGFMHFSFCGFIAICVHMWLYGIKFAFCCLFSVLEFFHVFFFILGYASSSCFIDL